MLYSTLWSRPLDLIPVLSPLRDLWYWSYFWCQHIIKWWNCSTLTKKKLFDTIFTQKLLVHFTNSYEESASNSEVTLSLEVGQIKKIYCIYNFKIVFWSFYTFLTTAAKWHYTLHLNISPSVPGYAFSKSLHDSLNLTRVNYSSFQLKKPQTNVSLPVEGRTDVAYRSVETLVSSLMTSPVGSWSKIKQK